MRTLKVETKKFDRKVREALEIQKHQCSPLNEVLIWTMDNTSKQIFGFRFFHVYEKEAILKLTKNFKFLFVI